MVLKHFNLIWVGQDLSFLCRNALTDRALDVMVMCVDHDKLLVIVMQGPIITVIHSSLN